MSRLVSHGREPRPDKSLETMAYKAKKTEHSGAKKGRGAFYGPKTQAKKASNRRRREESRDLERGSRRTSGR